MIAKHRLTSQLANCCWTLSCLIIYLSESWHFAWEASFRAHHAPLLTYNASSVLADILGPLVGTLERHIKNSGYFVDKINNLEVPPGQKLIPYDVTALFTSIPVPDAIKAVRIKLDQDPNLQERTPLSRERILELLSFGLNTTYFTYRGVIYKQKHGAAMGSPVSPVMANLYIWNDSRRLLFVQPPASEWLRYVDDTFTMSNEYHVDEFTTHLNSLDDNIKFTTEPEQDGRLPLLDASVKKSTTSTGTRPKTNVGLPYMQGTSEALTRVFKAHGVGTYHRPINTIRSILVHPKDKTPDAQKCGLVYQVECPKCPLTYIGKTGRMLLRGWKTISTSETH